MSADLSGRKVLVTGGASGIGAACAAAFATAGATVTIADLDADGAQARPLFIADLDRIARQRAVMAYFRHGAHRKWKTRYVAS